MDQFKRGDLVIRKSRTGKNTTIELYEQYHKYHGCLGIVMRKGEFQDGSMYEVCWFKPQGYKDFRWCEDYAIGHLDGRHRWDNATV